MKKKYLSKIFFIIIWFLTFVFASFWGYENPEKVEQPPPYLPGCREFLILRNRAKKTLPAGGPKQPKVSVRGGVASQKVV